MKPITIVTAMLPSGPHPTETLGVLAWASGRGKHLSA